MKRLLDKLTSKVELDHWFAEFVGVFFDRSQVGSALLAANRLRDLAGLARLFKRSP